jgi:pyruvate dehydrogenase E2 component (dihydrolipoamide acetyltransferase)
VATQEVHVPDIGNFKDVAVIEMLVKPGDHVDVDTPILTLETDKATMDVPSPVAGVIEKLHVVVGGLISTGSLIATINTDAAAASVAAAPEKAPGKASGKAPDKAPAARATPAPQAAPAVPATPLAKTPTLMPPAASAAGTAPSIPRGSLPPINEAGFATAHAGPSVRQFARELGVDLARVRGNGPSGRITAEDVKAFVKATLSGALAAPAAAALPKVPVVDYASFGPVEVKPLTRIQKISGPRLHASWINLPHVTQYDSADITELEATRKSMKARAESEGVKLTPLAFVLRACVKALAQFPRFNSSLDAAGENLVFKKYCHLGFAADTPNGLMVPVIRDADRKDVFALARALGELSEKARTGKLSGAEMQGGCFTVTSLGGIGGTSFTPIINAPEVAILGVSKASMQPVYRDNAFVPRLLLPLSLSYDHRVIDGAEGARFVTALSQALADVKGLLEPVA